MTSAAAKSNDCPVCETASLDVDAYGFDRLCTACGFVVHETTEGDVIPDWVQSTDSTDESEHEPWQDYCRVTNGTEAQLADAFGLIEEFSDKLPIPIEVRKHTAQLYTTAFRADLTDGRKTESMVAACLRIGSLQATKPIPVGRVTTLPSVSSSALRECRRAVKSEIEEQTTAVSPVAYLWLFEVALEIEASILADAKSLLETVEDSDSLVGKDPAGIAAAGVYFTGTDLTQQAVADPVGVSTETIRLRVADLNEVTA